MPCRDKKKLEDKRIWTRMGRELVALRELLADIATDPDYQDIMDRKTWDKLLRAQGHIDTVRCEAENRMNRVFPDCTMAHTFYPLDKQEIYAAIEDFRDTVRKEAVQ